MSTWLPYPPDNGAKIRAMSLVRYLGKRHDVHLLSFLHTAGEEQYLPMLRAMCAELNVVRHDPFERGRLRAALGFASPYPRDVLAHYCPEMARAVEDTVRRTPIDVAIGATATAGRYLTPVTGVPKLLEEQNSATRMAYDTYRAADGTFQRLRRWASWRKTAYYESRLLPRFDSISMVSELDRDAALQVAPCMRGRVVVIPNGVDLERNVPGVAEPQPDTLVFNGALTYHANAEAMRFFVSEVMPLVRLERPAATLTITGPTEGVDLSWVPADGSVRLSGYVSDVRPVVAGSWVCVAPLRTGGGTRLKILEALALETPVVATSKGAEGLNLAAGREVLIADAPAELARAILSILGRPSLREQLAQEGRRAVVERYGWETIGALMDAWLRSAAAAGRAMPAGEVKG